MMPQHLELLSMLLNIGTFPIINTSTISLSKSAAFQAAYQTSLEKYMMNTFMVLVQFEPMEHEN